MKRIFLFALPALLITPIASVAAAEFVEFGSDLSLLINAISADGSVVVGETFDEPTLTDDRAFVWTRGDGLQLLGVLPGHIQSWGADVSADGSVVVGASRPAQSSSPRSNDAELFRWTEHHGLQGLGRLPGFTSVDFPQISDDGSVVVSRAGRDGSSGFETRATRWTEETGFFSLLPPGTSESGLPAISANGSVVALQAANDGFVWSEESGFESLGPNPQGWDGVSPALVSGDGSVVFGTNNDGVLVGLPFRWTAEDGIQTLPLLPGTTRAQVEDLSPDGSIMVGFGVTAVPPVQRTAFVWDEQNGTRDLRDVLLSDHGFSEQDLPELHLARGLSADAMTIVGTNVDFSSSVDIGEAWAIYLDKPLVSFGLPGDYNNNGTVEQADLDLVLLHWGATAVPDTWTNDLPTGAIDQDELDGVLLNWGNASSPVAAASVPEPSGALLIVLLTVGALAIGRRV